MALVPVLRGGGGVMTDWEGRELTLDAFLRGETKGRVVAASGEALWREAVTVLQGEGHILSSVDPEMKRALCYGFGGLVLGASLAAAALHARRSGSSANK